MRKSRKLADAKVTEFANRKACVPMSAMVTRLTEMRSEIIANLFDQSVMLTDTSSTLDMEDGSFVKLVNRVEKYYTSIPMGDRSLNCLHPLYALHDSVKELTTRCDPDYESIFNSVLSKSERAEYSLDDLEELPEDPLERVNRKFLYEKKHVWMLAYSTVTLMLRMAQCSNHFDVEALNAEILNISAKEGRASLPHDTWIGCHMKTLNLCIMSAIGDIDNLDWREISQPKSVVILAMDMIAGYWLASPHGMPILQTGYCNPDYNFTTITSALWYTLREVLAEGDDSSRLEVEWRKTAFSQFETFCECGEKMAEAGTNMFSQQVAPSFLHHFLHDALNNDTGDNLHEVAEILRKMLANNCEDDQSHIDYYAKLLGNRATIVGFSNLRAVLQDTRATLVRTTINTFAAMELLQASSATHDYLPESNEPTLLCEWFNNHLLNEKIVSTLCAIYGNNAMLENTHRISKVTEMAIWAVLAVITFQRTRHPFYRLTHHLYEMDDFKPVA